MAADPVPVILVHGWNSHPGVWNRLIPRLDAARIPYSRFSHEKMAHESVPHIAGALRGHVRQYRDETGYDGALDTVSHSMGTCITRYWLEVMDGKEHEEHVRQLIGLGPPNNGSALAKLFHDPEQGALIINRLTGVFVPEGFDPEKDKIVRDVRPGSRVMAGLHTAGIRNDILYRHWQAVGRHAMAGVLVALVQVVTVGAIYWFTTGQYGGVATSLGNQVQRFFGNFFLESIVTYAGTAGVFIAIDFARAVRDEAVVRARLEAHAAALESSVAQARLDALSMQMNPHFLFNTLTAISGLVSQERKAEAREVIQRLGELLRQSLGNGNGPFSTVGREVELLEDYLYIQRIRFSDRLSATVEIDEETRELLVPAMLLQPLVENAIRHGIEPREGKGTVQVSVRRADDMLRITISDSGIGFALGGNGRPAREGIGIANTRERLDHIYGSAASLALTNQPGGGAEAIVIVPIVSEPAEVAAVR